MALGIVVIKLYLQQPVKIAVYPHDVLIEKIVDDLGKRGGGGVREDYKHINYNPIF